VDGEKKKKKEKEWRVLLLPIWKDSFFASLQNRWIYNRSSE
jgi:hypothetical protein